MYLLKGKRNKKWIDYCNNSNLVLFSTWLQYKKEPFNMICTGEQMHAKAKKYSS